MKLSRSIEHNSRERKGKNHFIYKWNKKTRDDCITAYFVIYVCKCNIPCALSAATNLFVQKPLSICICRQFKV